ncbi:MAG TPA: flagellar FliJ family protein [Patescibacteria group bacterium]|nr:flagellar FliJ family protein [Patescibacteria group bacterium]
MADLSVLIRLHKHELDEKRRALGELHGQMAELERRRRELERSYEAEKEALRLTGDVHFTFAHYAETVRQQRQEWQEEEQALEEHIERAKEALMETFSELKKYEMTQEERERLEAEERLVKEGREMDAIGLEGFRRKSDENT